MGTGGAVLGMGEMTAWNPRKLSSSSAYHVSLHQPRTQRVPTLDNLVYLLDETKESVSD